MKISRQAAGPSVSNTARRAVTLALALALSITLVPATADAQFSGHKKWWYALIGAAVAGIPAYVFSSGRTINDNCNSQGCITVVVASVGATVGFLIGAESDSRYNRRMAAGPSIKYEFQNVPLGIVPDRMTGFSGGAAVVGVGGARIVRRDGTVLDRAFGVRGIEDVAVLPMLDLLVLSTAANLIAFPVAADSGQGEVIDERGGGAMELFDQRLAVASFDSLRLLQVHQASGRTEVETHVEIENFDFVTDMAFSSYGRTGWVLSDNLLRAYNSDLENIGEIILPAAGRTVRADGNRLVVAAGSNGTFILDATDPGAAEVVQHFEGVRFAYAADIHQNRLFVAAGPEGVVVVDISTPELNVIGVARELNFASDVVVDDRGIAWIMDRDGQRIQIAQFESEAAAGLSR